MRNEIPIKVKMTIKVERCIAKEIKNLIEKHKIVTEFSCCGHGGEPPWVQVGNLDSQKEMVKLGYKKMSSDRIYALGIGKQRVRTVQAFISSRFKLKSKCKCGR